MVVTHGESLMWISSGSSTATDSSTGIVPCGAIRWAAIRSSIAWACVTRFKGLSAIQLQKRLNRHEPQRTEYCVPLPFQ